MKVCLFCGHFTWKVFRYPRIIFGKRNRRIVCTTCKASGPYSDSDSGAIARWNHRPTENDKPMKNNKPNWKDAPTWAQWIAMDRNSEWCWFESKPILTHTEWINEGGTKYHKGGDWITSLGKRP